MCTFYGKYVQLQTAGTAGLTTVATACLSDGLLRTTRPPETMKTRQVKKPQSFKAAYVLSFIAVLMSTSTTAIAFPFIPVRFSRSNFIACPSSSSPSDGRSLLYVSAGSNDVTTALPTPSNQNKKFKNFDEMLSTFQDAPVLIDFHATYCGPCKLVQKELLRVRDILQGKIHVFTIDTERFPSLGTRFQVAALPTLLLFKDGEVVHRIVGVESADNIVNQLSDYL